MKVIYQSQLANNKRNSKFLFYYFI